MAAFPESSSKLHSFVLERYGERGRDLWEALVERRRRPAILQNPWAFWGQELNDLTEPVADVKAKWVRASKDMAWLVPQEWRQTSDFLPFYTLDLASIFPVLALNPQPDSKILDLCSAPGGKAIFTTFLTEGKAQYTFNELSPRRQQRLKLVIKDYLPVAVRDQIRLTRFDGSRWGLYEKNQYDAVVADVPCSGEHYLFADAIKLQQWKEGSSKKMAFRQYALLAAALMACRSGGRVVYSTCSLSPWENDEVLRKLKKKKGDQFRFVPSGDCQVPFVEATEFGAQILPDRARCGPIYWSQIEKL